MSSAHIWRQWGETGSPLGKAEFGSGLGNSVVPFGFLYMCVITHIEHKVRAPLILNASFSSSVFHKKVAEAGTCERPLQQMTGLDVKGTENVWCHISKEPKCISCCETALRTLSPYPASQAAQICRQVQHCTLTPWELSSANHSAYFCLSIWT